VLFQSISLGVAARRIFNFAAAALSVRAFPPRARLAAFFYFFFSFRFFPPFFLLPSFPPMPRAHAQTERRAKKSPCPPLWTGLVRERRRALVHSAASALLHPVYPRADLPPGRHIKKVHPLGKSDSLSAVVADHLLGVPGASSGTILIAQPRTRSSPRRRLAVERALAVSDRRRACRTKVVRDTRDARPPERADQRSADRSILLEENVSHLGEGSSGEENRPNPRILG